MIAENDKSLKIDVKMEFDNDRILIEGNTVGVYEDVFKSGVLDLAEIHAKGEILPST